MVLVFHTIDRISGYCEILLILICLHLRLLGETETRVSALTHSHLILPKLLEDEAPTLGQEGDIP